MIREIVRETVGFAHYEKRMMEMIKIGSAVAGKKALALGKKRLGSMRRARAKKDELENIVQTMKHREEKDEPKEEPKKDEPKKEEPKPSH